MRGEAFRFGTGGTSVRSLLNRDVERCFERCGLVVENSVRLGEIKTSSRPEDHQALSAMPAIFAIHPMERTATC